MKELMHVFAYDTYNDMINNTDLHTNCLVITMGKEYPGDGQGDLYYLLENQRVNKYTSGGELLRNDSSFRAVKVKLDPESNAIRIAEDAKYTVRSLINCSSNNYESKINELEELIAQYEEEVLTRFNNIDEKYTSEISRLNMVIEDLTNKINSFEEDEDEPEDKNKEDNNEEQTETTSTPTESVEMPIPNPSEEHRNSESESSTQSTEESSSDESKRRKKGGN